MKRLDAHASNNTAHKQFPTTQINPALLRKKSNSLWAHHEIRVRNRVCVCVCVCVSAHIPTANFRTN